MRGVVVDDDTGGGGDEAVTVGEAGAGAWDAAVEGEPSGVP
jgi:hypothetical protein